MAENRERLDIKNFQPFSSVEDLFKVLLVDTDGGDASITIALLRTQLAADVKPAIIDGVWWIGKKNTGVDALGKTPELRLGANGVEWKLSTEDNTAWKSLISIDSLRLKFEHLTTEQKRELIPHLSDFTAAEIAELQKPAGDMIARLTQTDTRVGEAEILREHSEVLRNSAESTRVTQEQGRVSEESLRKQQELERKSAEQARISGEVNREAKEGNRKSAEELRVSNENTRKQAETLRATTDTLREANEDARKQAESLRVTAEGLRATAESRRVSAESARVIEYARVIEETNATKDTAVAETSKTVRATALAIEATGKLNGTIADVVAATELAEEAAGSVDASKEAAVSAAGRADNAAGVANAKAEQAATAAVTADTARALALEVAEHPTYIGPDYYVRKWNTATKAYDKTDIFCKGDAFSVSKVFASVALMQAAVNQYTEGKFVLINTGNVEDEDTAKLYVRSSTGWDFLTDMSGARGFTGKTPQLTVGNVVTGIEGSQVSLSLSDSGTDANGNPVYAVNLSIPRGDMGKVPVISAGTVTTSAPGSPASVELVPAGTDASGNPMFRLNMTIPQGAKGDGNMIVSSAGLLAGEKYFFVPDADNSANGKFVKYTPVTIPDQVQSDWNATGGLGVIKNKPTTFTPTAHKHGKSDISDFPTSMPASDVPSWAKAESKPTYTAGEVGAAPANHAHAGVYEPAFSKKGAFNKDFGNIAGTVCQGNDSRLSDARTPTAHKHGKSDISDFPTSMPASDVSSWAKASAKPGYTAAEVGASPSNHTHNYAGSSSAGGSASSADKLSTARKINGVAFDGTKDITIEAGGVDSLPVNTILESTVQAGNIFGSKWLKCDGSIIYKADYPSLKLPGAGLSNWAIGNSMYDQSHKIIYINGIFLSCGDSGVCCWSTDGKTWTRGSGFDTAASYYGIAYGNGVYVLVGGSRRAYWSADGKSWSACVGFYIDSDNGIGDITYGNGVFVCIDSAGFAYSSTDGKSWLKVGEFGIRTDPHITYGNGLFVCACSSSVIYYSTDGRSWRQGSGLVSGYHRSVAYGNGIFVTVGHGGVTCFSTDGKSWMKATAFEDKNMFAITWGSGLFVAVGSAGTSFHSVDGKTWVTGSSLINTERYFFAVGYGNGMFVCCDAAGLSYWCVQLTGQIILPNRESSFIKALE